MGICDVYILRLVVWMGYFQYTSTQETTCYYGWTEFSGHCYYFSDSMFSRDEAIEDCKGRGDSNLATVANQDTNDCIRDNRPSSEPYWIGLRPFDDNSWGWNDGKIDQMIAWHDDQPSDSSSCGVFWSDVPAFHTHQCNENRQYICESDRQQIGSWSQYNGHWYIVNNDTATQPEAANHCVILGGYLARLTTSDEIAFVKSLTSGHLWVGLTSLVWDDGTAYNWNNWVDNVPIPHSPCAALDRDTGRWRLNDCHHEHFFICSRAPQLHIYTYGGNAEGDPCVLPFIYQDFVYYGCIIKDHIRPWCSTTHSYDDQLIGQWGNCPTSAVTVSTSAVFTSTTPLATSSALITTQSPVQDQTTFTDTTAFTNKFLYESQTTLVPSTYMEETSISSGLSHHITTGTTSEPQDLAGSSDLESRQVKVLHIVLGIVYGLIGVMVVVDIILAIKYWKLVHTEARDDTSIKL